MIKLAGFSLVILFGASFVAAQGRFDKYRKVEGHEVRPGVLVIPTYTAGNEICEIGIETLRYSPGKVSGLLLSREEVDSIIEEIVPATERGPLAKGLQGLTSVDGNGAVSMYQYENVSVQVFYTIPMTKKDRELNTNDLVAVVKWKNRVCKQ